MRVCRALLVAVLLAVPAGPEAGPMSPGPQVELDRIVSRVAGRPIMQSDVRQARALQLVPDTTSDAATLRALENRWLMLEEIDRAAPALSVPEAAVDQRLAAWRTQPGRAESLRPMAEAELRRWFSDDLRIDAYLERRFGMLPGADRIRAQTDWIGRLRQRAELD